MEWIRVKQLCVFESVVASLFLFWFHRIVLKIVQSPETEMTIKSLLVVEPLSQPAFFIARILADTNQLLCGSFGGVGELYLTFSFFFVYGSAWDWRWHHCFQAIVLTKNYTSGVVRLFSGFRNGWRLFQFGRFHSTDCDMRISGCSVWGIPNPNRFVESFFSTNTKCGAPNRPWKQRKQSARFDDEKYRTAQAQRGIWNPAEIRSQSAPLAFDHFGFLGAIGEAKQRKHRCRFQVSWTINQNPISCFAIDSSESVNEYRLPFGINAIGGEKQRRQRCRLKLLEP